MYRMKIRLTTDYATTDLVTQEQAEKQLSISAGYDTTRVLTFLDSARKQVEHDSGRAILNTTFTLVLDYFPPVIILPKGRIQAVNSVKYLIDGESEFTTWDSSNYYTLLNVDDGTIRPVDDWPGFLENERDGVVEVEFVAGYGSSANIDTSWAETAILLKLSELYDHCDESQAYRSQVDRYKHYSLAYEYNEMRY